MHRTITKQILDILFPPSKREEFLQHISMDDLAVAPEIHRACGINVTSLMPYEHSTVRDCIRALKFDGSQHAANLCAETLADFLLEEMADERAFSSERKIIITPVPLGKKRERERGYNQVELILNVSQRQLPGVIVQKDVLTRTRETKPQMSLTRKERLENVRDAFALTKKAANLKKDAHIILIDDITTTGATLAAAAKPLKKRGYRVTALALARA